jgi:CDP-diacylglycerol--serine O-phosphatidyltransferase
MNIRSQIPNLLTLGNLACGSLAIMFISNLEYLNACVWLIFTAGVFDVLDGLVARKLGISGEMGKQLDSLADLVSFGVFPAVLLYKFLHFYRSFYGGDTLWGEPEFEVPFWLPYIGILLIVGAAYRLARFNIDPSQSSEFKGLPAPANGLLWTSLFAAVLEADFTKMNFEAGSVHIAIWLIAGLVVLSALFMVSRIRLFAFKFKDPSWQNNKPRWIFIMLIPATVAITYLSTDLFFLSVPILLILYVLISILFNYLIPKHEVQS